MRHLPKMSGQFGSQGTFHRLFCEAFQQSMFAKKLFRRLTAWQ